MNWQCIYYNKAYVTVGLVGLACWNLYRVQQTLYLIRIMQKNQITGYVHVPFSTEQQNSGKGK